MSKPKVTIKGQVSNFDQKEKAIAPRQSNFFLTINTNQRFKDDDLMLQNDTEVFVEVIEKVLNNIQSYVSIPVEANWDNDVQSVDVDYVVEKGNEKNCLHTHILMKIKHRTRVQLNYKLLKEHICADLGLPNIHLKNILLKMDNSDNILEYLNKYTK
jgi:hypothetical protein